MNRQQRRANKKNAPKKNTAEPVIKSVKSQLTEPEQMAFLHETFQMVKQGMRDKAIERCRYFSQRVVYGEIAMDLGRLWVGLDNEDDKAWAYFGLTCSNSGHSGQAVQVLKRALDINPENLNALYLLTNALIDAGEFKKARPYSDKLVADHKAGHPAISEMCIQLLLKTGNYEQAQKQATALHKLFPNIAMFNYLLGTLYMELRQPEKAKPYLIKCCELEPTLPNYWYNAGLMYDRIGDEQAARECMRKALDLYNQSDVTQSGHVAERTKIAAFLDEKQSNYQYYKMASFDEIDEKAPFVQSICHINNHQEMIELTDTVTPANEWMFLHDDKAYVDMLMTNDDKLLLCSKNAHMELILKKDFPHKSYEEPCILLGGALNYYHWICDYLPRMSIVDACPDLKDLPIIVHHELSLFHIESLRALGYDVSRFVCAPRKHYLDFKRVFVPHIKHRPLSVDGKFDLFQPALTQETLLDIRARFADYMKPRDDLPKRIFVSRKNAQFRRCENEDEIFELAQSYGFEKVKNEDLSFTDQIALYAGADAVMGPHGAGFTNMVFARPEATLIELYPMQAGARFFDNICSILGQNYSAISGPRTNSLSLPTREFWDFEVDVSQVKKALDNLGTLS